MERHRGDMKISDTINSENNPTEQVASELAKQIEGDKQELRSHVTQKMRTLSSEQMQKGADALFLSIEGWLDPRAQVALDLGDAGEKLQQSKYIALFWSMPDEIPTHRLIEKWHAAGHRVVLPVIDKGGMSFGLYDGTLKKGRFGIMEPTGERVASSEIGYMFVPFVAVDPANNRLGRGGGFYDRFLAANPHIYKHAIGFSLQLAQSIPIEEGDVAMDRVSLAKL